MYLHFCSSELIAYSAKELSCSLCDKTFDGQLFLKQHLLNEHLQTQTTKNGDGGRQSDNSINTGTEEIEKLVANVVIQSKFTFVFIT